MLQAVVVWVVAAAVMLGASLGVAAAAAATAIARGVSPAELLTDHARSPLTTEPLWIALGTAVNELVVLGVVIVAMLVLKPTRSAVMPFTRPSVLAVFASLCVVFGLAPLADVAGRLMDMLIQSDVTAARIISNAAKRASAIELAILLFCVAVMPGVIEELMFRGLLTAPFARRSTALGLIVPTLMFGAFHVEPTQVAGTTVLGFGFALARLQSGSLVPCMLAHAIYNGAVVMAVRHGEITEDPPLQLAPLAVGLALVALGAVLLWRGKKRALSSPAPA